jgi:uncharacterized protein
MAHNETTQFEWDEAKNLANQRKHGLSFEEASGVFRSASHLEFFDDHHSELEDRFVTVGQIARGVVLVVWTERDDDTVRIISARYATKREAAAFRGMDPP